MRVLLLEDSPQEAERILRWLFELYGGEASCVHVATMGAALSLLWEGPKDLLLLDLDLVDDATSQDLHTMMEEGPRMPTVVMLGEATDAHAISAIMLGAEEYLPKLALSKERLQQSITYALARHQRIARLFQRLDDLRARLQEFMVESRA